jgi:hypothetical protein
MDEIAQLMDEEVPKILGRNVSNGALITKPLFSVKTMSLEVIEDILNEE